MNFNKKGAGVLCCRYNNNIKEYEYLLVRKSFSLDFIKLITTKYKINKYSLRLDRLSKYELYMIYKFGLKNIYIEYFKVKNPNNKNILKYINNINRKFGLYMKYIYGCNTNIKILNYVKKLCKNASISDNLCTWEIPKGHKSNNDCNLLECGIRELKEETGIIITRVFKDIRRYEKIRYLNTIYNVTYFMSMVENNNEDVMSINNDNSSEIICAKWFTLNEINTLCMDNIKKKIINSMVQF